MARAGDRRWIVASVAVLLLAAVALFVLLPGRDDDGTRVGPDAVAQAAERTERVDGVRYSLKAEMDMPQVGRVSFTGSGEDDLRGERGRAKMDMSEVAARSGATGEEADPDKWKMEMVYDRSTFYMKFPLLEPELDGKSWMSFDLLAVSKAAGIDPSLIRAEQQQGSDPTGTLRYLRAVSDDVERVGSEDIRGAQTTHYRATVEFRKYPDLVGADEREQARKSVERLIELNGGSERTEMEVWVGPDKMIHRLKWDQAMKVPGAGEPVKASYTADYFDFDARVSVEPPPADDVKDVTDQVTRELAAQR